MAANQDRAVQENQQQQQPSIVSRTNTGNQSIRSGLSLQPISGQMQSTIGSHAHSLPNQATSQNVGMSGQENSGLHVQPNQQQQQIATSQSEEQQQQVHQVSSSYGTPLSHFGTGQQKPYSVSMSHCMEDRELQRRMEEVKRKQAEFEEGQKKQEEELRQHHQLHSQQQMYQQSQHSRSQQPLHPSMLRLDNLIINGPNVSMCE